MKKLYIASILLCASGVTALAQRVELSKIQPYSLGKSNLIGSETFVQEGQNRAAGDTIVAFDFSDPSKWSLTNAGNPPANWSIGTNPPSGAGGFPIAAIKSTTANNGFALFDSDGLGSDGAIQDANLTTANSIDLSVYPAVILKFQQFYRNFSGTTKVQVSNNGTNWVDYLVNKNVASNNSTPNPDFVAINITATAGGKSTVWIRFNYTGEWDYAWMVDDIAIVTAADFDLTINDLYFSEYSKIPLGQQNPIEFSALITNSGGAPATNVKLDVAINTSEFTGSSAGQTLNSGAQDSLSLATSFTPTAVKNYSVIFTASMDDADANPADNSKTAVIAITDSIYSRDNANYTGMGLWNGAGNPYTIASIFDIYTETNARSISAVIRGGSTVGADIRYKLFEIDGSGEFIELGETDFYTLKSADLPTGNGLNPKQITLPFLGGPIFLEAGKSYLAAVDNAGSDAIYVASGNDLYQPIQTAFLYDYSDATWYYITSTPMIRLNVGSNVSINENNEEDFTVSQNKPNPAKNSTTIVYSLQSSENVTLAIFDVTGKMITSLNEGTKVAGTHSVNINLDNLNSGIYYYTLTAGNTRVTKKMSILK